MPYPGSPTALTLTVDPNDATTRVTVTLTAPDGTVLDPSPTPITSDGGHTWTATPTLTQAGKWVAHWLVTNTGAGAVDEEVWVSEPASPAAAVTWRPELWQVADYIPARTLVGAVDGYGNPIDTFDSTTRPTGDMVARIITAAVAWVQAKTGPVDASLDDLARSVAAKYAASQVELTYPDNGNDLNTAQQLYQQAVAARDDLWRANEAVTGEDPEDPAAQVMPVYSFPPPYATTGWYGGGWAETGDYGPPFEVW